jgi:hypothetical protein
LAIPLTEMHIEFEVCTLSPEEALRIWEPWKVQVAVACANCDAVFTASGARSITYLFCSPLWREIAKHVRWARRKVADDTIDRPDIAEALQTRVALMLSGGYPEQARRVRPEVREQLRVRSGGCCEQCGQKFLIGAGAEDRRFTVHHVRGSSNDLANLRAYCSRCNTADVQSRMRPVTDADTRRRARAFERRYLAKRPMRACDDEQRWPKAWRTIGKRRFIGEPDVVGRLTAKALRLTDDHAV